GRLRAPENDAPHAAPRRDADAAHDADAGNARGLDGRNQPRVDLAAPQAVRARRGHVGDGLDALHRPAEEAPRQRPRVDVVDERHTDHQVHGPFEMITLTLPQNTAVPSESDPVVSVVMPCLNEAETVARCVEEAQTALSAAGLSGEVIVADNGSTDGSRALAEAAGARV